MNDKGLWMLQLAAAGWMLQLVEDGGRRIQTADLLRAIKPMRRLGELGEGCFQQGTEEDLTDPQ